LTLLAAGTARPDQPINLSAFGETNIWLQVDLKPTLAGRLQQLLFQSPKPTLRVWCAAPSKAVQDFCAPAPMLAAGFVASPLLTNDEDLLALYGGKPVVRPRAYSIDLGSNSCAWKSEIQFRIYAIENTLGGRALDGSANSNATP
jgi:hypothetical protein